MKRIKKIISRFQKQTLDEDYETIEECDGCGKKALGTLYHAESATGMIAPVLFLCYECQKKDKQLSKMTTKEESTFIKRSEFDFNTEDQAWKFLDLLTRNGYDDYNDIKPHYNDIKDTWLVDILPEYTHAISEMEPLYDQVIQNKESSVVRRAAQKKSERLPGDPIDQDPFEFEDLPKINNMFQYSELEPILKSLLKKEETKGEFVVNVEGYTEDESLIEFSLDSNGKISYEYNADLQEVVQPLLDRFTRIHNVYLSGHFEKPTNTMYGKIGSKSTSAKNVSASINIFFRWEDDARSFIKEVLKSGEEAVLLSDLPVLVEVNSLTDLIKTLMKKYQCKFWDKTEANFRETSTTKDSSIISSLRKLASVHDCQFRFEYEFEDESEGFGYIDVEVEYEYEVSEEWGDEYFAILSVQDDNTDENLDSFFDEYDLWDDLKEQTQKALRAQR